VARLAAAQRYPRVQVGVRAHVCQFGIAIGPLFEG
jgi:hypothetical protein